MPYCRKLAQALIVAACTLSTAAFAEPLQVIYPVEQGRDYKDSFPLEVLRLALEKSGQDFVIAPSQRTMTENRSRDILRNGTGEVTVAWYGTGAEFEHTLLPVRIPISRGLLGHRIFLIRDNQQPRFSEIRTIEDLAPLIGVQGIGWSDVEILEGAGLQIQTGEYDNLFSLIDRGRADYFSRGVNEAFAEYDQYRERDRHLAVEEDLVLIYPFAKLFFVSKKNRALHDAIYEGLVAAYDDGSYQRLFESHPTIRNVLERANLAQRRALYVDNPLMTPETLAIPARYWFSRPGT